MDDTPEPLSPSTTSAPRPASPDPASLARSSHPLNNKSDPAQVPDERTSQEPGSPGGYNGATTPSAAPVEATSESSKASSRKKKAKSVAAALPPVQLHEPLQALPASTPLPDLTDFNLRSEQLRNPLFVAISKVLIVYGNAWQSANDLVDGIRHFELANLGGRTPKGTVQGAISTALALSAALKTFEPIEKQKMNSTTYYRMAEQALLPSEGGDTDPSDAGKKNSKPKAPVTNARRKVKRSTNGESSSQTKRRTVAAWDSDTMSSDSSDEDGNHKPSNGQSGSPSSSKRARTGSPHSGSTRSKVKEVPNGLKKLPKGYVYDTEINQSALMNLSINPSQTGEFMAHLRGQKALEKNEYPDKRAEYGVDLTKEPSMFSVEQQVGYTYPRLRNSGRERLPKTDCEDGYAVADLRHEGGFLGRLFCITDGHGGRACSSFVIATIPGAMQVILGKYRPEDISLPSVQELVKSQITEAVRLIDKEYLDYKKQQYLLYKAKKIPHDPGSDGTTLIVNIFIDKWVICINVGDSRSMLGSRDSIGRWNVEFASEDHTPSLERLAQTIYANGGEFVTHDDKVIRFDPTIKNDKKHRQSLREARIRVKDGASNLYGIPYRTRNGQCASVNLGACIGDVLYKLDPVNPVLSCKPDITFIDITNIHQGYLLMASDGLWDYVQRGGKIHEQNSAVCQFVGDKIDRGWNYQRIVCTLADREGMNGLYSDSIQEYDDFTAILVSIGELQSVPPLSQTEAAEPKEGVEASAEQGEKPATRDEGTHNRQGDKESQEEQENGDAATDAVPKEANGDSQTKMGDDAEKASPGSADKSSQQLSHPPEAMEVDEDALPEESAAADAAS
ncbi:Protein phosphatase 1L [Linnemannia hyalina]|uniref:Protein phosphatase 1L n=1 Tax=Linnemannia hyalina TaxID=64524 RepID=A0A9P7XRH9_9FUNG|nr:Protein phosphatase 1L [Linnemannia hyalina]